MNFTRRMGLFIILVSFMAVVYLYIAYRNDVKELTDQEQLRLQSAVSTAARMLPDYMFTHFIDREEMDYQQQIIQTHFHDKLNIPVEIKFFVPNESDPEKMRLCDGKHIKSVDRLPEHDLVLKGVQWNSELYKQDGEQRLRVMAPIMNHQNEVVGILQGVQQVNISRLDILQKSWPVTLSVLLLLFSFIFMSKQYEKNMLKPISSILIMSWPLIIRMS